MHTSAEWLERVGCEHSQHGGISAADRAMKGYEHHRCGAVECTAGAACSFASSTQLCDNITSSYVFEIMLGREGVGNTGIWAGLAASSCNVLWQ
jgi:hypothetical protein